MYKCSLATNTPTDHVLLCSDTSKMYNQRHEFFFVHMIVHNQRDNNYDKPFTAEVAKRRTFAIISHPDAGKTTITEKVLLFGQAIQTAGTVKGRGSNQHAKSDWMEMEKQRGISITTSVMQFPYHDCLVNLLDTQGTKTSRKIPIVP